MAALDGDLGLVRPAAADLALAPSEDRAGLGVDEELGHVARGEPLGVGLDGAHDVGRLAVDRDLARPGERRATVFAGRREGLAIDRHLGVGEAAQHRAGQHALDEDVLLQHHLLAGRRAEVLEHAARVVGPVGPGHRRDDAFHVGNALHALAVRVGPVEAERRAPVVEHEDDAVAEGQRIPQCVQVLALFGEGVALRTRRFELGGVAHADQVAGDQAPEAAAVRHHVAPQIGRGRVAVLEDDRVALALIQIGHAPALHGEELLLRERGGADRHGHGLSSLRLSAPARRASRRSRRGSRAGRRSRCRRRRCRRQRRRRRGCFRS